MPKTRFIHVSDFHLEPVESIGFPDLFNKRVLGYLSWQRKRKYIHENALVENAIEIIKTLAPDHICITGDQVNLALDSEFKNAVQWLEKFGNPNDVSLVYGNHDNYVKGDRDLVRTYWAPWMSGDGASPEGWPYMRQRGDLAIIGVSSGVPTGLGMATGHVDKPQLEKLDEYLVRAKGQNLFRVVMIHHPPQLGATTPRKSLTNAIEVQRVLTKAGCEVVLHGHIHEKVDAVLQPALSDIDMGANPVHVYGAGSLSMNGKLGSNPGHFYVFDVDSGADTWQVTIQSYFYDPETRNYKPAENKDQLTLAR